MKKHLFKKKLPKLGKNNKGSWHLNQDLLPPSSSPPAHLNRNYTLKKKKKEKETILWRHSQNYRASFPLSSQSRFISHWEGRSPAFLIPSKLELKKLNSHWMWPRSHGFPSSNQSLSKRQMLYPTRQSKNKGVLIALIMDSS